MSEIVRNMLRRKVRTGLTVVGIAVGVFAVTVMGAMSEYFSLLLDNGEKISGSVIDVQAKENRMLMDIRSQLNAGTVRQLRRVDGVKVVIQSTLDLLGEVGSVSFGVPEVVVGIEPEYLRENLPFVELQQGRWLEKGDGRVAVVGADVVRKRNLTLGDAIEWREKEFRVVGILALTRTAPDSFVYVPIEEARRVLENPTLITAIRVIPSPGVNGEELTARINAEVPDIVAKSPKQAMDEVRQSLAIFQVIMLSGALIAAMVGGLSVANTMIMSVNERTREIGIKKAVGASRGDIVKEYVLEATLIGVVGGVIGLVTGWGATGLLNESIAKALGNSEVWVVTPRLVVLALGFAAGLGALAGLYPAWRGASLRPVEALRAE